MVIVIMEFSDYSFIMFYTIRPKTSLMTLNFASIRGFLIWYPDILPHYLQKFIIRLRHTYWKFYMFINRSIILLTLLVSKTSFTIILLFLGSLENLTFN